MRPTYVSAVALAAALATVPLALAQNTPSAPVTPPAAAGQEQGNPRLQQAERRLQQAAEQLQQAAQSGDRAAVDRAKQEAQQALDAVRQALSQLPPDQRQQVQQRADRAEQALQGQDTRAGADAVLEVVHVVGVLAVPTSPPQGAQILVEQAAPQVTIQRPEPQVTVQQRQPEIIVRQPAPTVTVDIPQPEIIVRMREPEVTVAQAPPQVQVRQPEPQIAVQPAEPQVVVDPARPQVQVQQLADGQPNVQIEGGQQPQIRYERAEPRVVVNQAEGQPRIRVEEAEDTGPAAASALASPQEPSTGQPQDPLYAMRGEQIIGKMVYGANGEEVGEIDNVVIARQGRRAAAVVGVGGFLGIGERDVAIPLDQLRLGEGDRLTTVMTKEQIGSIESFEAGNYEPFDRSRALRDAVAGG